MMATSRFLEFTLFKNDRIILPQHDGDFLFLDLGQVQEYASIWGCSSVTTTVSYQNSHAYGSFPRQMKAIFCSLKLDNSQRVNSNAAGKAKKYSIGSQKPC